MVYELLFFVSCVGVLPVLINKSTEGDRFYWLKPWLREAWTILFLFFLGYYLHKPETVMQVSKWRASIPGLRGYLVASLVGALGLSAYWWFVGFVLRPASQPVSLVESANQQPVNKPMESSKNDYSPILPSHRRHLKKPNDGAAKHLPLTSINNASQKEIASADPAMPFGLEVVVTTTKEFSPVALEFIFSGEVGKVQAIPVLGVFMMEQGGIVVSRPNTVFYQRQSPAFTPRTPMVLYVYSKTHITMKSIQSVVFNFPRPESELKN